MSELREIGFSPVSSALIVALLAVVGAVVILHRKSVADREAWHADTRKMLSDDMVKVDKKLVECEDERKDLYSEVGTLKATSSELAITVNRLRGCPRKDCPMRLPP